MANDTKSKSVIVGGVTYPSYDAAMQAMIAELATEAKRCGASTETLRLWSEGKLIGGPIVRLGTSTPKTCTLVAAYRAWRNKQT